MSFLFVGAKVFFFAFETSTIPAGMHLLPFRAIIHEPAANPYFGDDTEVPVDGVPESLKCTCCF